ncbi:helix-turn-helix domain-containing protein [Spirillospora sp. NPDC127200]
MTITAPAPARTRRDLGARLRALRLRAGLTGAQLADALGCSPSKVSRIESGTVAVAADDLRRWAVLCSAEEQAEDLVAEAAEAERAYTQWRVEGLRRTQHETTALFERTNRFRIYESRVVPGILQTADYAARILATIAEFRGAPADDVNALVQVRQEHQTVLDVPAKTFAFVIEESVFRAPFCGADVLRPQLERLLAETARPNSALGIIPMDRPRKWWPMEAFYLYDDGPARVQLIPGRWIAAAPGDVEEYSRTFEDLAASAVYGDDARAIISGYL